MVKTLGKQRMVRPTMLIQQPLLQRQSRLGIVIPPDGTAKWDSSACVRYADDARGPRRDSSRWRRRCSRTQGATHCDARFVQEPAGGRVSARGFKPVFPQWTLRFELFRIFIRVGMELYGERVLGDESYASIVREQSEWFGTFWGRKACRKAGKRYESVKINGLEHIWLRSQTPREPNTKRLVVLYAHGGGFAIMSPRLYIHFSNALCSLIEKELARQVGVEAASKVHVEIFLANYRKVPKFSYPTQPRDIAKVYEHLLYHENLDPSQVVLAGDSAGAGLIMSAMLRERRTKPYFLPLCAALLCPYVDLTGDELPSSNCILTPECCNAVLRAYHPSIEDPSKWGDASSVHYDLRNLPPVFVQTGDLDSIHQHAYDLHKGMPHVFPIFPAWFLPHADLAIQKMAAFIVRQLRPTLKTNTGSGLNPACDVNNVLDKITYHA
ncbi:alpha/beta hydrolase fold [Phytophthora infestans]|uniref:Alpha/beta hydrolase fold n=1 Tax=Phytophthora infestans TaxID=4787 RepID=A0A833SBH9_PHYIN|nr:alpha/beta hydrolase fold [Phytophthora infestans]